MLKSTRRKKKIHFRVFFLFHFSVLIIFFYFEIDNDFPLNFALHWPQNYPIHSFYFLLNIRAKMS